MGDVSDEELWELMGGLMQKPELASLHREIVENQSTQIGT